MRSAWRLTKTKLLEVAFDGAGARKHGGRWNSPGIGVVYVSGSLSLALLEVLVHVANPALLSAYSSVRVEFPEDLVEQLPRESLPPDWRRYPAPPALRALGDAWAAHNRSAILEVPSAIVSTEINFLLNPGHERFKEIVISTPVPFAFDPRLPLLR